MLQIAYAIYNIIYPKKFMIQLIIVLLLLKELAKKLSGDLISQEKIMEKIIKNNELN